jgi:hypothetical protein
MAANLLKLEFHQQPLVVLAVQASAESAKGHIFARINPLEPEDQMTSQKCLVDAGIDTFASKNELATA